MALSAEDEEYGFRRLDYDSPNGALHPPRLPPPPIAMMPTKPNSKFLSFLLQAVVMALVVSLFFLFLGIASLVLIHICIAGRALRHRRPHRGPVDTHLLIATPTGLSPKEVQMLPSCSYAGTGPTAMATDCPVCLDGFKDAERCRVADEGARMSGLSLRVTGFGVWGCWGWSWGLIRRSKNTADKSQYWRVVLKICGIGGSVRILESDFLVSAGRMLPMLFQACCLFCTLKLIQLPCNKAYKSML
ncbi:hypothetical protein H6P81_000549 [Aristolochia fimbriata]|uniref:RING/U-box superfamily protein n=1 Tax=Aristolochia fimbriata TaxID=158543 RepID=A0AAV7F7H3_ARIFI|nr:hypothetical protein H6P81_000549 [Aristolochia fimbriata]